MTNAGRVLVLVIVALICTSTANANIRTKMGHPSRNCWWAQVQVYREGVATGDLWHLTERVNWCSGYKHLHIKYVSRVVSHWENPTWSFGGYDRSWGNHASDYSWESRGIAATFNGYTPTFLVEHNYPTLNIIVDADGYWTWRDSCGC
jgi:hypothetical protein